ncbi:MAG: DUF2007 domain-containing protein [Acidobacteriota bacterium]
MPEAERVLLATVMNGEEASLLEGALRAAGIDVVVESRRFSQEPVQFGLLGDIRLWVTAEQEGVARKALESFQGEQTFAEMPPELADDD